MNINKAGEEMALYMLILAVADEAGVDMDKVIEKVLNPDHMVEKQRDVLNMSKKKLVDDGHMTQEDVEKIEKDVEKRFKKGHKGRVLDQFFSR